MPMQQQSGFGQFQTAPQQQFNQFHQAPTLQQRYSPATASSQAAPRQHSAPPSTTSTSNTSSNAKNLMSMLEGKGMSGDLLGTSSSNQQQQQQRTAVPMSALSASTSSMSRPNAGGANAGFGRSSAPAGGGGMSFDEFAALQQLRRARQLNQTTAMDH